MSDLPTYPSVAEKMRDLTEPSRFRLWPILFLFALTSLFYVAWYMEKFDEATTPAQITMATGEFRK